MDLDQTAPMLKFVSNVRQLFAADDFRRWHFQMHFSWHFMGLWRMGSSYFFILVIHLGGCKEGLV